VTDGWINPMGTDGIEFVEFAAPEPARLDRLFRSLGFRPVACHRSKDVILYRQGGAHFVLNSEPQGFAQAFARVHGPSVCAVALRVKNARAAVERAERMGAEIAPGTAGPMELNIPAIRGIGGSLLYLVDRYPGQPGQATIYDIDFVPVAGAQAGETGVGIDGIDRLRYTVHRGRKAVWDDFHARLFSFRDQDGVMTGPCGRIRLDIREPSAQRDAAEGFLDAYHGEGVQRIVLAAANLGAARRELQARGMVFIGEPSPDVAMAAGDGIGPVTFALIQQA
jgi:4-hydroxyphenylpyruvate dioxygenase